MFLQIPGGCGRGVPYGKAYGKKVIGCIAAILQAGAGIINWSSGSLDMNPVPLGEGFIFLSAVSFALLPSALIALFGKRKSG